MQGSFHPLYSTTRIKIMYELLKHGDGATSTTLRIRTGYDGPVTMTCLLRTLVLWGYVAKVRNRDLDNLQNKIIYSATPAGKRAFDDMVKFMEGMKNYA